MRFAFADTHAYPGCRVRIDESDPEDLAEFRDGAIAPVVHRRQSEAVSVTVAPYRTKRGTQIGEKTWILHPRGDRGVWIVARPPQGRPAR